MPEQSSPPFLTTLGIEKAACHPLYLRRIGDGMWQRFGNDARLPEWTTEGPSDARGWGASLRRQL